MTLLSSENRAAVAAPAPLWSTGSSAVTAPSITTFSTTTTNGTSPERKSRTLQGPSSKEWTQYRETIINLYKEYPLKRVSEIMRKQYGFVASKRMYDKRFREWNIFKNGNSEDGPKSQRRRSPGTTAMAETGRVTSHDSISQGEVRKTIRAAKSVQQGFRKLPAPSSPLSPPRSNSELTVPHTVSGPSPRGSIHISDLLSDRSFSNPEQYPSPHTLASSPELVCATPESIAGSDDHVSAKSEVGSAVSSPAPSLIAYQAQLQSLAGAPLPPLVSDSKTRTLQVITLSLHNYYEWQLQSIPEGVLPDEYLGNRSPVASTKYWDTIKNAIYLVKVAAGSPKDSQYSERAWPAMKQAGVMAVEAMTSQPFDFLKNLFTVLSPANLRAHPALRSILLQFLSLQAEENLPGNHPITLICQELSKDENCQEVSRRGLQCMLDIFNTRLGRSRAVTIKLTDSLATLLRRNGEFSAARDIIQELLKSCQQAYGHDSSQARAVENELAHLYMATSDYDLALEHCMSVVARPPTPASIHLSSPFHHDGISAHTMEDIAEIYHRKGDLRQCILWLERAAQIALKVWGRKALATCHIVDKITGLSRELGRELLESATRWEATVEDPATATI
ncbi:hypothetical protein QBC38DRAFT_513103 [Podospora fimiseda]|uniref:Clr5 domain-containing protein n=1 Tax=Podospora fimiseda TaxID=252190 RepID=A0AAN7BFM2_9PEZI|nr:hypothetical protein QBC38DRAFT_513103 [Podospora fimiseda]